MKKVISLFLALTFVFTLQLAATISRRQMIHLNLYPSQQQKVQKHLRIFLLPNLLNQKTERHWWSIFPPQATRKQQPLTSHRKPAATCSSWNRQNPTRMKI